MLCLKIYGCRWRYPSAEGLTSIEIGLMLAIPEGTVRTRIAWAKRILRSKIEERYSEWAAQSSDTSVLEWAVMQQQFAAPLQIQPLTFQPIAIEEINKLRRCQYSY